MLHLAQEEAVVAIKVRDVAEGPPEEPGDPAELGEKIQGLVSYVGDEIQNYEL